MFVNRLSVGPFSTNCYIVKDETSGLGVVIDPGFNAEKIISEIENLKVRILYILLTHGHFDHYFAAKEIKDKTKAKIVIHKADEDLYNAGGGYDLFFNDVERIGRVVVKPDILVSDNDALTVGSMHFKYISTPGHSRGSCCILCDKALFSGDTLFYNNIGRTDFYGGSMPDLLKSLKNKIYPLSDDIDVYPGHNEPTNLGFEKENNAYFRE